MQRVATELHTAFEAHPEIELSRLILQTSWKMTYVRVVPFLIRLLYQIPKQVRQEKIDLVLFSSMVTAALAMRIRATLPRRTRLTTIVHGQDVTLPVGVYQRMVPSIFKRLDAVIPVSRATGDACAKRGCPRSRIHVLPNGVDPERFVYNPDPELRRAALRSLFPELAAQLPEQSLVLCSVGRQVKRKGFDWFVDQVMPRLPRDVQFWLAGEGPMAETIQAAIDRHALADRVRLLGRVTEAQLEALYQGADLFVMPNVPVSGDMEGFGVVMLEAGLSGLPAIASRLEGIQDVIAENRNGHLIPSKDIDAFVAQIRYYHERPDELEALGERARQYTLETFTWPAVADRYVDLFKKLIQ